MTKSKKTILSVLVLMAVYSSVVAAKSLNVYSWTGYIDPSLIKEFEKSTGINVRLEEYSSVEEMERGLKEGAGYDIVVPSHFQLPVLIKNKWIEKLDFSRLKNFSNVDDRLLAAMASFGGADEYVVPYLWTATGVAVNRHLVERSLRDEIPDSWSLIFYDDYLEQLEGCGVGWFEAPKEVFSLKANFVGGNLNRSSERTLKKYSEQLAQSIKYVREVSNLSYVSGLEKGELCVAMAWAGHAAAVMESQENVEFMLPEEGGLLTIDTWVILKDSPKKDAAYRFIDYMLKAESGRRNTSATKLFSHLPSSMSVKDGVGLDPSKVLGSDYRRKLYFVESLDLDKTRLIESFWRSIKKSLAPKEI